MQKWWSWSIAICLLMIVGLQGTGQAQKQSVGSAYIDNEIVVAAEDKPKNVAILFTLFKGDEVVRSSELVPRGYGTYIARWDNLPAGVYELHCEAAGYGKLIKKIAIAANETSNFTLKSLPEKDEVQGAGPTLFELQKRIQALEAEVAELKKGR